MSEKITICVVDDESGIRNMLAAFLTLRAYEVVKYDDGAKALEDPKLLEYDIVISDLNMPNIDGLTLLTHIKEKNPESICIIITGMATLDSTIKALRSGIDDYILKPFELKDIELVIEKNLSRMNLEKENVQLQKEILQERNLLFRRNKELEIFNALIFALSHSYNYDNAIESVSDKFGEIIDSDFSFYFSSKETKITAITESNCPEEKTKIICSQIKTYLSSDSLKSKFAISEYVMKRPEIQSTFNDILLVPFNKGEDIVGVLGFVKTGKKSFTKEQKSFFSNLAIRSQKTFEQIDHIVESQNYIFSSTFDYIQSIILRVDLNNNKLLINKKGAELLKKDSNDVTFDDFKQMFDMDWDFIIESCFENGSYVDKFFLGDEDDQLVFGVNIIPFVEPPFMDRGLIIMAKDITDKQKIDDMKGELISNVSHELKTPIAITKEYLSLLIDNIAGELNEQQKEFVLTAENNLKRLEKIIGNFLKMSKMNSGTLLINNQKEDVKSVFEDIIESIRTRYKTKKMTLNLELDSKLESFIFDKDILAQIIVNLLENAFKYSDRDTAVTCSASLDENGHLLIKVADEGRGIAKKDMEQVFERFFRTGLEKERLPGSGLGLAITKELVENINGKIWLESVLGSGSTFFVEIPEGKISTEN